MGVCFIQHGIGNVDSDDFPARTYLFLQKSEIQPCSATELDHRIAIVENKRLYCPFTISPMTEAGEIEEQRTPVVPLGPFAIEDDKACGAGPIRPSESVRQLTLLFNASAIFILPLVEPRSGKLRVNGGNGLQLRVLNVNCSNHGRSSALPQICPSIARD